MAGLFDALSDEARAHALACLGAYRKCVDSGSFIFREGEPATQFGLVVTGSVNVIRYTVDGREKLLLHLGPGEVFGTSFALGGEPRHFANIQADGPSEVVLLDGQRVLAPCQNACPAHVQLLTRLLETLAKRNAALARKIDCLTQRTTAEKLMTYLRQRAKETGSKTLDIPFSRQQLADYLNVDRAALSTEIGKLVRAGVLSCTRSRFVLK